MYVHAYVISLRTDYLLFDSSEKIVFAALRRRIKEREYVSLMKTTHTGFYHKISLSNGIFFYVFVDATITIFKRMRARARQNG